MPPDFRQLVSVTRPPCCACQRHRYRACSIEEAFRFSGCCRSSSLTGLVLRQFFKEADLLSVLLAHRGFSRPWVPQGFRPASFAGCST